ncbi:MAG TPA: hypothetical protein DCY64_22640 [Hydrogenophaga sp.]|uniref:hypothetical protein n=1 Tax=Hydrogenophaga sp. TaxID=1904254 RepID=UPI0008AEBBCA|nr:hypothetical protein [Hydrogenophaga sp.]OGA78783.1 MAG: hypothetical protein A2X73_07475 [Burkholderiales bacterium GWE1_65_30]OGA89354.1 MAG: hypothetical protein A2X72_16635 [Burkholderiales bacterium GWF1_66_17]HAX23070.1 hypothetical protein [Hydrogenophaga sp.]HBU17066.1 hypothetical protein [Hydrogenophaga sp.]
MSCEACTTASHNPITGRFHAGCDDCAARALAGGRELFDCLKNKQRTPEYDAALTKMFGEGNEEAGHARVREWSKKINQHKKGNS